jgi:hypothetical protein
VSIEPRFIGYDLRGSIRDVATQWDDSRREGYLLRVDAPIPLSVDWPCPTGADRDVLLDTYGLGFVGLTARPPVPADPSATVVAISIYPGRWTERQRDQWDELVTDVHGVNVGLKALNSGEIVPPSTSEFRFLGYDVGDWGLVSGLSNCGFMPDEPVAVYREKWGPKLNRHHLFDDINDAHEFVEFADRRVPEHAPFFVFGLWCQTH